jgi:hypothetical protein
MRVHCRIEERHKNSVYAKGVIRITRTDNAAACLYYMNYKAILRPIADRTDPVLPLVVSRGRSIEFKYADAYRHP